MPFVLIQVLMVGLIIAFPTLVSSGLGKEATVDVDKAFQQMQKDAGSGRTPPPDSAASGAGGLSVPAPDEKGKSDDDAMKSLLEGFKKDADKKP